MSAKKTGQVSSKKTVVFTSEANADEKPLRRKQLQGKVLKNKTLRYKQTSLKKSIVFDAMDYDYDNDYDCYRSEFDDLVFEISSEEISNVVDYTVDDVLEQTLVHDTSDELFDTMSDSGISGISSDDFSLDVKESMQSDLMKHCKTASEKLNALIIATLLKHDTPDMFVDAHLCSYHAGGLKSVDKFAHGSGDLHTAMNVVVSWLQEKQENKELKLSKWCRSNGICAKTLGRIVRCVKDIDCSILDETVICNALTCEDRVTEAVCDMFKDDICLYLGHPDIGYHNISTGQILPCCHSSSVHLLTKMPKYVICRPRHYHLDNTTKQCHYILPLTNERGINIINELFPDFNEQDVQVVSQIPEQFVVGWRVHDELVDDWQRGGLRHDLSWVCSKAHVHLDVRSPSDVKLYTPEVHHDVAASFLRSKVSDIQRQLSEDTRIIAFPKAATDFRLLIGRGPTCSKVYFQSDSSPELPTLAEVRNDKAVQINTDVCVSLEMNTVRFGDLLDVMTPCTSHLRKVLSSLCKDKWRIHNAQSLDDHTFRADVILSDHYTARRASTLLKDDPLVSFSNQEIFELQLRSFKIWVHSGVMTILGDKLFAKMGKWQRLNKYSLEYETCADGIGVTIYVLLKNTVTVMDILHKLQFLNPFVFRLRRLNNNLRKMLGNSSRSCTQLIGKMTSTFLYLVRPKHHVLIYGSPANKAKARRLLFQKLCNRPIMSWRTYGKIDIEGLTMPDDFFIHLNRTTEKYDEDVTTFEAFNILVDFENKGIWLHAHTKDRSRFPELLKNCVCKVLKSVHCKDEFHGESINFDYRENGTLSCVTCYTEIEGLPYTLESCGHSYCMECIELQLETALKESNLPFRCGDCSEMFTITDMCNLVECLLLSTKRKILKTSVGKFLGTNFKEWKFCPKPNCDGIYKNTGKDNGGMVCAVCSGEVCTACFEPRHDGVSCETYQAVGKWMDEDVKFRRKCPNCMMGIEKDGGCNNVVCFHCKKNICWICLSFFNNDTDCYKHMDVKRHWKRL